MSKGFDKRKACLHSIVESLSDEEEVLEVLEKLVNLHFPE
jgi:nitric oxide reductase NorQ protein